MQYMHMNPQEAFQAHLDLAPRLHWQSITGLSSSQMKVVSSLNRT